MLGSQSSNKVLTGAFNLYSYTLCIHMWTIVDPFILQSTWIVKFEQAKSFSFPFSLIRDIAMHFVSCFLRERKKDVASFFFNFKGLWKTGKKRLVLFYIRQRRPSSTPAPAMFKRQLRGRPDHDHHNALRISALV